MTSDDRFSLVSLVPSTLSSLYSWKCRERAVASFLEEEECIGDGDEDRQNDWEQSSYDYDVVWSVYDKIRAVLPYERSSENGLTEKFASENFFWQEFESLCGVTEHRHTLHPDTPVRDKVLTWQVNFDRGIGQFGHLEDKRAYTLVADYISKCLPNVQQIYIECNWSAPIDAEGWLKFLKDIVSLPNIKFLFILTDVCDVVTGQEDAYTELSNLLNESQKTLGIMLESATLASRWLVDLYQTDEVQSLLSLKLAEIVIH